MASYLPPRNPSSTPEEPNPQGQNPGPVVNPGDVAGGSNVPEPHVPRWSGKEPMLPRREMESLVRLFLECLERNGEK